MQARDLFPRWIRRPPRRLGPVDALVLGAFVFTATTGVLVHEPWFDEAQSWLLAQDASLFELITELLRYEGHPPLWYALLQLVGALGLPYQAANLLATALATLGVFLFLRLPGVPAPVRYLVPFGFFMVYQYAVIARAYALLFPIMAGIATIYPERRRRPILFAVLLVLLSEVGLYGLALAWALAALHVAELLATGERLDAGERRSHLVGLAILVVHTLFLVAVLWPPSDLSIATNLTLASALERYSSTAGRFDVSCLVGSNLASSFVWLALVYWLFRQRLLVTYLALNLSATVVIGVYYNVWHEGFFFHSTLLAATLAFQHGADRGTGRSLGTWLLAGVLAVHASWAFLTLRYDLDNAYSASHDLAEYIRLHGLDDGEIAAIGFASLGVQPYFDRSVYSNYRLPGGGRFWDWSTDTPLYFRPLHQEKTDEMRAWFDEQLAAEPDHVVLALKYYYDRAYETWLDEDPRYARIELGDDDAFRGSLFWKRKVLEHESFALYERVDAP